MGSLKSLCQSSKVGEEGVGPAAAINEDVDGGTAELSKNNSFVPVNTAVSIEPDESNLRGRYNSPNSVRSGVYASVSGDLPQEETTSNVQVAQAGSSNVTDAVKNTLFSKKKRMRPVQHLTGTRVMYDHLPTMLTNRKRIYAVITIRSTAAVASATKMSGFYYHGPCRNLKSATDNSFQNLFSPKSHALANIPPLGRIPEI